MEQHGVNRQLRRRESRQKPPGDRARIEALIGSVDLMLRTARHDEALAQCIAALANDPQRCELHQMHGVVLQAMQRFGEAIDAYDRAIALDRKYLQARVNKAVCAREAGRPDLALETLEAALRIDRRSVHVHYNKALALCDLDRPDEAVLALETTIELKPDLADARFQLAFLLEMLERYGEAIAHYEQAVRFAPTNAAIELAFGGCLQVVGRFDRAAEHLRKAISLRPHAGRAHYMLAYSDQADVSPPARAAIERALRTAGASDEDRIYLHFAAARLAERAGDHDEAFTHYVHGNRLRDATLVFDPDTYRRLPERIASVFTPDFLAARAQGGSDSRRPVFVIGMPRSGTTLVEQIIAAHPHAYGAGELANLERIGAVQGFNAAAPEGYPENVAALSSDAVAAYARAYLDQLPAVAGNAARVVDKTPGNALVLGVLAIMFPHARFVHCDRDAMDSCWSIYCHNFATDLPYACDFEKLAVYHRAHERTMQHWRSVLGDRLLDVSYEDLVAAPETGIRTIIDHCGLGWDDRCLEFHTLERGVHSSSLWQVRKPMFATSIGKWRRFETHLAPLRAALGVA
jgi:Tfp pilus assembly protein PilF